MRPSHFTSKYKSLVQHILVLWLTLRQNVVTMIGQSYVTSLVEVSARNNDKTHEINLMQGAIDCFLPQPARLTCTVQSSPQQNHKPPLTDSTWHANVSLIIHWRVEECDLDVVDTQNASSSLRSSRRSGDQHSCHFQRWRYRVIVVSLPFLCSDLHGDQTSSCLLASVVLHPLCTDELLSSCFTLKNLVEDMMVHHLIHFRFATLTFSREISMPVLLFYTRRSRTKFISFPESSSPALRTLPPPRKLDRPRRLANLLSNPDPSVSTRLPPTVGCCSTTNIAMSVPTSPTPVPISLFASIGRLIPPL